MVAELGGAAMHFGASDARAARESAAGSRPSRFALPSGCPTGSTSRAPRSSRSRTRTRAPAARCGRSTSCARSRRPPASSASQSHLDGARLANAAVALGVPAAEMGQHFDTVTLCLSKGLGCPLGALIAGSVELMAKARVEKHRFGGAMRQAGIVAAAGSVRARPQRRAARDDHARARRLAEGWRERGVPIDPDRRRDELRPRRRRRARFREGRGNRAARRRRCRPQRDGRARTAAGRDAPRRRGRRRRDARSSSSRALSWLDARGRRRGSTDHDEQVHADEAEAALARRAARDARGCHRDASRSRSSRARQVGTRAGGPGRRGRRGGRPRARRRPSPGPTTRPRSPRRGACSRAARPRSPLRARRRCRRSRRSPPATKNCDRPSASPERVERVDEQLRDERRGDGRRREHEEPCPHASTRRAPAAPNAPRDGGGG